MKINLSIATGILLAVFFNPSLSCNAAGQQPADIVIVYTGDGQGRIEPSGGCCGKNGGMARRATRIKQIKESCDNVIVVDSGDFLSNDQSEVLQSIRAEYVSKAMKQIGYDALNIADGELDVFNEFIRWFGNDQGLKITSLNVNCKDTATPGQGWPPYIIKQVKNIRVAVIGIIPTDLKNKTDSPVEIHSESESLRRYLPEIQQNSDLIILLSHVGWNNTVTIVKKFSGIDVAIVGHESDYADYQAVQTGETLIVKNVAEGIALGIIDLWVDGSNTVVKNENHLEVLGGDIVCLPEYKRLETDFTVSNAVYLNKQRKEKQMKYLSMSPEEYIQLMIKENKIDVPK